MGDGHEIKLFIADLDAPDIDDVALRALLSDDERAKVDRAIIERVRVRRLRARAALRSVLGAALDRAPRALVFSYGDAGKPAIVDDAIAFNASDTAGIWALAIGGDAALGLDVELHRDDLDVEGVGAHVYVDAERAVIASLPSVEARRAFFRLWTLKESYMKAVGLGFHLEPSSFEFDGFSSVDRAPRLVASTRRSGDLGVATSVLRDDLDGASIAITRMSAVPLRVAVNRFDLRSIGARG